MLLLQFLIPPLTVFALTALVEICGLQDSQRGGAL